MQTQVRWCLIALPFLVSVLIRNPQGIAADLRDQVVPHEQLALPIPEFVADSRAPDSAPRVRKGDGASEVGDEDHDMQVETSSGPTGGCCTGNVCTNNVTQSACEAGGGNYLGDGISCTFACANGACCRPDNQCANLSFQVCNPQPEGNTYFGGSTCSSIICECNGNGIEDDCDVSCGTPGGACDFPGCGLSADCNANGVPDECEDCNNNGLFDPCDTSCTALPCCNVPGCGGSTDCNGNLIPDVCENPNPNTIGACCFVTKNVQSCASVSEAVCTNSLNGMWRGPCTQCPVQNVAVINESDGSVFVHVIGPPVECEPAGPAVFCSPGQPKIDPWKSPEDGSMCHNFGVGPQSPPIPAGFFGVGSDPFSGAICLKGASLNMSPFGDADTLIERTEDPLDRCALHSPTPGTVSIEIVALSLVSVNPMTVTYNGGQSPEQWNMAVDLSPTVTPPAGMLTATKTHCNGGTYTSTLNVQPRFTFTKVGQPSEVRVLDTGAEGIPHVTLNQTDPAPWVSDVDPNLGLMGDPCSNFHAGVSQQNPQTSCDCNGNLLRDACDIDTGASQDCQLNGVPDECELVNNDNLPPGGDGIPDQCNCTSDAVCGTCGTCNSTTALCAPGVSCATDSACGGGDTDVCTCNACSSGCCVTTAIEYGNVNCSAAQQPNLDDILYELNDFSDGGSVTHPSNDIAPACTGNNIINLDDILGVLAAFAGGDPCGCP